MAASISGMQNMLPEGKPSLIATTTYGSAKVLAVHLLREEDGFITISDDRLLKVWLRRKTGQFVTAITHGVPAVPSALEFCIRQRRLFIGLENGVVTEFELESPLQVDESMNAEDHSSLSNARVYYAHSSGVSHLIYASSPDWLISAGKDKQIIWHCANSAKRIGGHRCPDSWTSAIQFDEAARYCFVGLYSGVIQVLNFQTDGTCMVVTSLNGHAGSVRSLAWDAEHQLLFSGAADEAIIVWDIGGRKGEMKELQGHKAKIMSVWCSNFRRRMISVSADGLMGCWDATAHVQQPSHWNSSDTCELCRSPFFWNVRQMWNGRVVGLRQHHCRRCGRAICAACCKQRSRIPRLGFEYAVRVCNDCIKGVESSEWVVL